MNKLLIALGALVGVARFDSEDAVLTEATAKVTALKADAAALQLKLDQFPPEEAEKEDAPDLVEELKVAKARIAELEAAAAKKDEEEKEMKADARLKDLQAIATEHDVKHDGLDLAALRLKLAQTRSDSFTAETPVVALDAVIATIPAKKPARSDARSRYDHSPTGGDSGNRADANADGSIVDVSDPKSPWYNPDLKRADAAFNGAT